MFVCLLFTKFTNVLSLIKVFDKYCVSLWRIIDGNHCKITNYALIMYIKAIKYCVFVHSTECEKSCVIKSNQNDWPISIRRNLLVSHFREKNANDFNDQHRFVNASQVSTYSQIQKYIPQSIDDCLCSHFQLTNQLHIGFVGIVCMCSFLLYYMWSIHFYVHSSWYNLTFVVKFN